MRQLLYLPIILLSSLILGTTPGFSAERPAPEHVQIRLYSTLSTVAADQPFTVIIEQLIEPEWHTYWQNPGDSGTPTSVKWDLPDGGSAGPLENPIPKRIPYGPMMNFGFSDRALFSATITPPATLSGETFTVRATLDWLSCKDICLPEGGTYTLILPVSGGTPDINADITDILHDMTAAHPVKTDWAARFHDNKDQTIITFTPSIQALDLLNSGGRIEFFPSEWGVISNAGEQVLALIEKDQAALAIPKGDRDRADIPTAFSGIFVVYDSQGHAQGYDTLIQNEAATAAAPATTKTELSASASSQPSGKSTTPSFLGAVILALLGGLILNLMPCVFPVLSLKILSISQLSGAEKDHLRSHGLAYAGGVIATFLIIAALLMILQGFGAAIGWGFQLQQPFVTTLLAYLFTLIGFNLMGWFELDIARYIPARFHVRREGLVGSFATGTLATLVATPCTVPFMAAALGYALTHHPITGLFVFAALGAGLALPFVVLTFIPHIHTRLPKPGAWMLTLRQALAFPMFLTALWLLWVLNHQTGANGNALALLALILMGFSLWLHRLKATTKTGKTIKAAALGLSLALILCLTLAQRHNTPDATFTNSKESHAAKTFTKTALDQALATNQPVFVNMTAAWCITCKVNERLALATPATQELFARTQTLYLKGDWTNYNAEITAYLNQFGRKGVPLYVFYPAPDSTNTRPPPIVLPQILTSAAIAHVFNIDKK